MVAFFVHNSLYIQGGGGCQFYNDAVKIYNFFLLFVHIVGFFENYFLYYKVFVWKIRQNKKKKTNQNWATKECVVFTVHVVLCKGALERICEAELFWWFFFSDVLLANILLMLLLLLNVSGNERWVKNVFQNNLSFQHD